MFVKVFVIVSLIILGLIGCATNGSYNQSVFLHQSKITLSATFMSTNVDRSHES